MMEERLPCVLCLSGGAGSGKRFQIKHLLARHRQRGVFADLEGEDWRARAPGRPRSRPACWTPICAFTIWIGKTRQATGSPHRSS